MPSLQRVLIGMSGGVDSSVSAALLVEQGYAVEGVFLKVWSEDDIENRESRIENRESAINRVEPFSGCPWETDLVDAQAVANQLNIPLHIRNVQREYFERVVAAMKEGYARGETPNPDVLCNSEIKFGLLYDWAMAQGFDAVATGHYAQIGNRESGIENREVAQDSPLQTAADSWKDQTYFLWRVPKERFEKILFPIGHLTKPQVRAEAVRLQLPNAAKPDSQGICFLGKVDVRAWLERELGTVPGPVVTPDGQRVGTHAGAQLFTIGQRHGLGTPGGTEPFYVVAKDVGTNTLVVDTKAAVTGSSFKVVEVRWLGPVPEPLEPIEARIRHQGERIPCTIEPNRESRIANRDTALFTIRYSQFVIRLASPAFGIARGQSVVFYRGINVLGGGIIA